ncbi:MAG: hypothetical protein OXE84_10280 [Rhodobacteraceae bacterium]|nr:hypothetical protein [Paracoccaceae bacterium]MCY4196764.1 hypothetical protein [Paracoccaceae bacterium]
MWLLPQVGGDGQRILGSVGATGGMPASGVYGTAISVDGGVIGCCVWGESSNLALPLVRVLAAGTFGVHLEDHGCVDQATCRGDSGGVIGEQCAPSCADRRVGGDHQ